MDTNHVAMLNVIAWSEGTDRPGVQRTLNRGYDVIVGGSLFSDYSKHPNKLVPLPKLNIKSSAAGRYQIINPTWKVLQRRLKLRDFSPASQDAACIELLRECGALKELDQGRFGMAVFCARKIWASLPGAGYGQRENLFAALEKVYEKSGGTTA